ncbi:MAG: elongation factor P [Elusimicrobia bacterium]|nr:elongation factor P [Elusimicrobiota bacterium]
MDDAVCTVVWFHHHKPGKGGAYMRIKAKNITTGQIVEKNLRATEKVLQAIVERNTMQYLYLDGEFLIFMNNEDFTQISVSKEQVGDKIDYLIEGNDVDLLMYGSDVLDLELPAKITMNVSEAEPGVKGNTVSGGMKKVKLETGLVLDVPLFIEEGENIIVDTRTREYISRAD